MKPSIWFRTMCGEDLPLGSVTVSELQEIQFKIRRILEAVEGLTEKDLYLLEFVVLSRSDLYYKDEKDKEDRFKKLLDAIKEKNDDRSKVVG